MEHVLSSCSCCASLHSPPRRSTNLCHTWSSSKLMVSVLERTLNCLSADCKILLGKQNINFIQFSVLVRIRRGFRGWILGLWTTRSVETQTINRWLTGKGGVKCNLSSSLMLWEEWATRRGIIAGWNQRGSLAGNSFPQFLCPPRHLLYQWIRYRYNCIICIYWLYRAPLHQSTQNVHTVLYRQVHSLES